MAKKTVEEAEQGSGLFMSEEDFRLIEEMGRKIEELEGKVEKLRVALAGGTLNGDTYMGINDKFDSLSQKVEELEDLAVRLDVTGPPIPEALYASLTPDQLYLMILRTVMESYFKVYPTLLTGRDKPAIQETHLGAVVSTSKFLFERAISLFPRVTTEKTKK